MTENEKASEVVAFGSSSIQNIGSATGGTVRVGAQNMAQTAQILKPIFPGRRGDIARTAEKLFEAEITAAILGDRT
jgi:hypothetical protein